MNFCLVQTRFFSAFLLLTLIAAGCKTTPDTAQSTAPKDGYEYAVQNGDTIETIARAYRKVGLEVTAQQIVTENPNVKTKTVFINGLRCHAPEAGAKLFIPGDVKQKEEASLIQPRLTEPLRFANFTVSQIHSEEGITNLLNEKVYVGFENPTPDCYDWTRLSDHTNTFRAETINEFRANIEHDFYDRTTQDRIRFDWFKSVSDTLGFMQTAQPSQHSYLTGKYLLELPVSVLESSLNCCEGDVSDKFDKILKRDAEKGKTLKSYTRFFAPLHLTKVKEEVSTLSFYDATMEIDYYIKEIGRGDVDGDGNEDALIEIGWHTQGTMGGSFTSVVTRTGPDQKVKWVTTDKFVQCSPHIVKLVGVIKNQTFPGPPNYKSVAKGDAAEDYWILTLDKPIDVAEDPAYPVPDENRPQLNQRELQVNLDDKLNADYAAYAKFLGKKVEVAGELSQGFTVHHKTPVMIWVREIRVVE